MPNFALPVFVAARPLARRTLIVLGVPTAALCAAILARPVPVKAITPSPIALPLVSEDIAAAVETETVADRGSVMSREVNLVFAAPSGLYMKLADVTPDAMPAHAAPVYVPASEQNWMETSIAEVAPTSVPAHASWIGRQVVVDGTCTATVTRLAVAGRLVGDPGYAGDVSAWTADNVLELGNPMLVAELTGCTDGTFARVATLANPVELVAISNDKLEKLGKLALLRSEASRKAQKEWTSPDWMPEPGSDGAAARAAHWSKSEETEWNIKVLRHPTSGATFVSVQAQQAFSCGGPDIDVWGLYRVEDDGELAALDASLGEMRSIEKFIDVDHDGVPEVMGSLFLGGRVIIDAHGTTLSKLDDAFYGCPC